MKVKFLNMKNLGALAMIALLMPEAHGQAVLRLQDCYERAEKNYPLIRQRDLVEQTRELSLQNASKGALPRMSLGGQATYQSEVTQIPVEMPGVEPLSKDQYRVYGEVAQTLYQGGLVKLTQETEQIAADLEQQKITVDLYQLRNRVNELYFGILLMQEQVLQSELVKQDLNAALKRTEASIINGTALKSGADILRAEALRVDQRIIEMESVKKTYHDILGLFINQTIDDNTSLVKPSFTPLEPTIDRPELDLLEIQNKSSEANYGMLVARRKPRLELFLQGGYGRPGLNMLENTFSFYGLGGLRFSWQLSGYYTARTEKEIFSIRQQSFDVQKETFVFNTNLGLKQHEAEIIKYRRLMEVDEEIISLRKSIRETSAVQLEEGVITSTDFVREVNAEDQAKQNRVLHEIQWLMAQAKYQFTSGNN